jgi:hypothetical protein
MYFINIKGEGEQSPKTTSVPDGINFCLSRALSVAADAGTTAVGLSRISDGGLEANFPKSSAGLKVSG